MNREIKLNYRTTFDFSPFLKESLAQPWKHKTIQDFCSWFIGFSEGDGCFTKSRRGTDFYFIVSQGNADVALLEYIKTVLGCGNVYKQSPRVSRFMVQDKKSLLLLISLFNGNLVLPRRKKQFVVWLQALCNHFSEQIEPIESEILPSLNDGWISGFTDAEGCFTASFLSNSTAFRLRYILSQKGSENLPVLSHLILLFRGGALEAHSVYGVYSYVLSGVKKSYNVFQYFTKFSLLSKKRCSFALWQSVQRDVYQKLHLEAEGRISLIERAKRINSIKRKSR